MLVAHIKKKKNWFITHFVIKIYACYGMSFLPKQESRTIWIIKRNAFETD